MHCVDRFVAHGSPEAVRIMNPWLVGEEGGLRLAGECRMLGFHRRFPPLSTGQISLSPRLPHRREAKAVWSRSTVWMRCMAEGDVQTLLAVFHPEFVTANRKSRLFARRKTEGRKVSTLALYRFSIRHI